MPHSPVLSSRLVQLYGWAMVIGGGVLVALLLNGVLHASRWSS